MHKIMVPLAVLLIATSSLFAVVNSRPTTDVEDSPHIRRRRSGDLGDIFAGGSGILNDERKLPTSS